MPQACIATDLEKTASLVWNDSESGNYVSIRLVGTISHRDAIGTEVKAYFGGQTLTQQLVGGNGYMVTNEKLIHFGLEYATKVDRLEINWPSGIQQVHTNIDVNSRWLAIESKSSQQLLLQND